MSFPLYRCAACGSPHVVETTQTDGIKYDFVKGAIGTVVLGTGGAVAGVTNRTKKAYQCPDCGLTLDHPMPMELKCSIDLGVSSSRMRNGILVGGMQFTWEEITKQFRNIESGDGDEEIAQKKMSEEELLLSKATATQEEFEQAFDTLHQYAIHKYSSNNLPTKKEYKAAVAALCTVAENCYKYLPPNKIKREFDGSTPYRNWKNFYLARCIDDYTLFRYYEHTGSFIDNIDSWGNNRQYNIIKYIEPFLPLLVSRYQIKDTDALWQYDQNRGASFRIFTPDMHDEHVFWQVRSLIGGFESFEVEDDLWTEVALPKLLCDDDGYAYTDWAFHDSQLFSEVNDGRPQSKQYFVSYPEKKAEYDALLSEYQAAMKKMEEDRAKAEEHIQQIEAQIKANEEKRLALYKQRSEENVKILHLRTKIFGKEKAQAEIARLQALISEIEQQMDDLKAQNETLEEEKNAISTSANADAPTPTYKKRICAKMNYFIVWHPIEEAEEEERTPAPSEPLMEEVKKAEPDIQDASSTKPSSFADQLRELKALLDEGILTQEEFDAKKRQILGL